MSQDDDRGSPMTRGQLQGLAARGALWTMIHVFVSLPLAFLVNILLARVLGVEGFGRLAFLTAAMETTGVIVSMGIGAGVVQFGAKAHSRGRTREVTGLLSRSLGARFLWVLPAITVVILLIPDIPGPYRAVAVIFGVWVPALFSNGPITLTIENKTATAAKITMVSNVVVQTTVVATALVMATAESVWVARMVAAVLGSVLALFFVTREYRRPAMVPRWPRGFPTGFWAFAVPTGMSGILATLIATRSEVFLLQVLSDPVELGLYAFAFGLATHIFAPAQALMNPLIPAVAGLREVDEASIPRAFLRSVGMSATIVGLLVAVAAPTLCVLIPVLYGADFAPAAPMMLALSLTSGVLLVTFPMQTFVESRLRGMSMLRTNTVSLLVGLVLALLLIPVMGAWGAVVGKAGAVLTRLSWLAVTEITSFGTTRRELAVSLLPLPLAGGAGYLGYWVGPVLTDQTLLAGLLAASTAALAFAGMLRLCRAGITPADADIAAGLAPAKARPTLRWMLSAVSRRSL